MNGLRKAIKDQLPSSWEVILRKNGCLTCFIDYTYLSLPRYMKGKYGRGGVTRVKHMFNNMPLHSCFAMKFLQIKGYAFWEEVTRQVINYEFESK